MDKHLHIVTHDVPWPADFGGVTDLFYKIKTLHALGVRIHLHCFMNKRRQQPGLNDYCISVKYYPRKTGLKGLSLTIPYIVQSRNSVWLLKEIEKDNYPILLEGIHCTALLQQGKLELRKVYVRLHNVEHKYYEQLAGHEKNFFKKIYFLRESFLLKKYEKSLSNKATFLAVSNTDAELYTRELQAPSVKFIPVFLPWNEVAVMNGFGNFCLYHGNLSVNENEKAAIWLMKNVFSTPEIPFILAGKNPSPYLLRLANDLKHVTIIANPREEQMTELIHTAQVNVLPSFNATGIKLKLLNALFNGRHCLVNKAAVKGSSVEELCEVVEGAEKFRNALAILFQKDFTSLQADRRKSLLKKLYDNDNNGKKLLTLIY